MGTVMTDFEKKIYDQIASKDGRKGRDIALALSVDKYEVNSTLHKSAELKKLVWQDDNFRWHLIKTKQETQQSLATPQQTPTAKPKDQSFQDIKTKQVVSARSDLINQKVSHKTLGIGRLTSITGNRVKVLFEGRTAESVFIFPGVFGEYLRFIDDSSQQYVMKLLNSSRTEDNQSLQKQEIIQRKSANGTALAMTNNTVISTDWKRDLFDYSGVEKPSSSIMQVDFKGQDGYLHRILIVDLEEHKKSTSGIYWKNREISKLIIDSHFNKKTDFVFYGNVYHIVSVLACKQYNSFKREWLKFNDISQAKELVIYNQKGVYDNKNKGYELVDVQMYFPMIKQAIKVAVYYHESSDLYFMNRGSFEKLVKAHGFPNVNYRSVGKSGDPLNDISSFNTESKLMLLGYNVNQDNGLSTAERQNLLDRVIRSGQLSDAEVANHLEMLINLNSGKPHMANACGRWQADLQYVFDNFSDLRRKPDFYNANSSRHSAAGNTSRNTTDFSASKKGSYYKKRGSSSSGTKKSSTRQSRLDQERKLLVQKRDSLQLELSHATGILAFFKRHRLRNELSEVERRLSQLS